VDVCATAGAAISSRMGAAAERSAARQPSDSVVDSWLDPPSPWVEAPRLRAAKTLGYIRCNVRQISPFAFPSRWRLSGWPSLNFTGDKGEGTVVLGPGAPASRSCRAPWRPSRRRSATLSLRSCFRFPVLTRRVQLGSSLRRAAGIAEGLRAVLHSAPLCRAMLFIYRWLMGFEASRPFPRGA